MYRSCYHVLMRNGYMRLNEVPVSTLGAFMEAAAAYRTEGPESARGLRWFQPLRLT